MSFYIYRLRDGHGGYFKHCVAQLLKVGDVLPLVQISVYGSRAKADLRVDPEDIEVLCELPRFYTLLDLKRHGLDINQVPKWKILTNYTPSSVGHWISPYFMNHKNAETTRGWHLTYFNGEKRKIEISNIAKEEQISNRLWAGPLPLNQIIAEGKANLGNDFL
jgi:hypothetical protein